MIPRILNVKPLSGLQLQISFDDGRCVIYDVSDDLTLPGYAALRDEPGLFQTVQLDASRTVIYWSEEIDFPSDMLYQYGKTITSPDGLKCL